MSKLSTNGFFLDPTSAKFVCPNPNCRERTFVRYVNKWGEYLPNYVGRCDREIKCGYHYKASEYFRDFNIDVTAAPTEFIERPNKYYSIDPIIITNEKRRLLRYSDCNFSELENPFMEYLIDILRFDQVHVINQMLLYNIFPFSFIMVSGKDYSTRIETKHRGVNYYYVSANNEVRTARQIEYRSDFHRVKDTGKLIHLEYDAYSVSKRVKWCIFGEHLLTDFSDKRNIIIVEAEKTAFTMSLFYPEFIWLSVGGLNGISQDFDYCRNDVINYFIPDSDIDTKGISCADKWRNKIPNTIYFQTPYKVIDFHKYCTIDEIEKGFDILDIQLKDPDRAKQLIGSLSFFM